MVFPSTSNLLDALTAQRSFESTDLPNIPSLDGITNVSKFPLVSLSCDQLDSKNFHSLCDENDKLFFKVLEASCTGDDAIFRSFEQTNSIWKLQDIINRLDIVQGASPLHYASMNGHHSVVIFLLKYGTDADIWDRDNTVTPLMCAAVHGYSGIVRILLDYNCNIDAGLNSGSTSSALLWAVRRNHEEVVECLLASGASQNSTVLYSETPIHAATICGSGKILQMLIKAKGFTKVDFYMGPGKYTPLHLAASGEYPNYLETCMILLDDGRASVNVMDSKGQTPLHLAGASHDVDLVKLLLMRGANPSAEDNHGRTPLFNMISDVRESLQCLRKLLEDSRCDVNHQDEQGYTALHFAAFKEARAVAQVLLMNGADFSLKSKEGFSALSILRRKIPTTENLIKTVLDQAVKVSYSATENEDGETQEINGSRQNVKVKVNFNCIVAAARYQILPATHKKSYRAYKNGNPSPLIHQKTLPRKETAKVKCIVDENLSSLLLHPVVHAFLALKWQRARYWFLANFIFKAITVILFSVYVQLPYLVGDKPLSNFKSRSVTGNESVAVENDSNSTMLNENDMEPAGFKGDIPEWFVLMYIIIVTLATINGISELLQIIRSPRTQLSSLEPWIFLCVLVIMIFYMNPQTWGKTGDLFHRTMAATGLCLAWIDVWIYMGRFPMFGLSIRIFFKVMQNFSLFVAPHFCLFVGFVLSFKLLFPQAGDYSNIFVSLSTAIRIMAGDNGLPPEEIKVLTPQKNTAKEYISHFLIIYIYTAFVLTVGIVLMNMLIGLAVNDIQGIYAEASINRLKKQTILLNTLDTNFNIKWVKSWLSNLSLAKYHVNLFSSQNKTLIFKPYDSRDKKLSTDIKLALANINPKNGANYGSKPSNAFTENGSVAGPRFSSNVQRWVDTVNKLITKKDSETVILKKVDELIEKVNQLTETINNNK